MAIFHATLPPANDPDLRFVEAERDGEDLMVWLEACSTGYIHVYRFPARVMGAGMWLALCKPRTTVRPGWLRRLARRLGVQR